MSYRLALCLVSLLFLGSPCAFQREQPDLDLPRRAVLPVRDVAIPAGSARGAVEQAFSELGFEVLSSSDGFVRSNTKEFNSQVYCDCGTFRTMAITGRADVTLIARLSQLDSGGTRVDIRNECGVRALFLNTYGMPLLDESVRCASLGELELDFWEQMTRITGEVASPGDALEAAAEALVASDASPNARSSVIFEDRRVWGAVVEGAEPIDGEISAFRKALSDAHERVIRSWPDHRVGRVERWKAPTKVVPFDTERDAFIDVGSEVVLSDGGDFLGVITVASEYPRHQTEPSRRSLLVFVSQAPPPAPSDSALPQLERNIRAWSRNEGQAYRRALDASVVSTEKMLRWGFVDPAAAPASVRQLDLGPNTGEVLEIELGQEIARLSRERLISSRTSTEREVAIQWSRLLKPARASEPEEPCTPAQRRKGKCR